MPISCRDGKLVVRTNSNKPTPFLASLSASINRVFHEAQDDHRPTVVDVGCGNGRNSKYMDSRGWNVLAFDQHADYERSIQWDLRQPLPVSPGAAEVVLLQFVLMFLSKTARERLVKQVRTMVAPTGFIVVELYAAKDAVMKQEEFGPFLDELIRKFDEFTVIKRKGNEHLALMKIT
jgi:SAM-dependent methyltransferase